MITISYIPVIIVLGAIEDDNEYEDTSTGKFQVDCIKWHNYYRKLHGAPTLKHSAKLEDFARYRAAEMAKKDGRNFFHPDDLQYGENLAWNSIVNVNCRVPLKLWYDEWKIYNFNKPNITSRNGHFTQMHFDYLNDKLIVYILSMARDTKNRLRSSSQQRKSWRNFHC
ncbi:unnamed protein product, partial [Medioppia subpectinata]